MDEAGKDHQPQSEVDRIVGQINKDRGQTETTPEDALFELKRNIATNLDFVGMAALWATRPKMGKTELADELVKKGFEKMRDIYKSEIPAVKEVLGEMMENERWGIRDDGGWGMEDATGLSF